MIIDIHAHLPGLDYDRNGNYLSDKLLSTIPVRFFIHSMGFSSKDIKDDAIDQRLADKYLHWLNESMIDRAVFLAYDAVHNEEGEVNWEHTHMLISNDYIAKLAKKHKKVLFGASIHPYRKDALEELERVIKHGACLIKWLPTGQNIDLHHPKSIEFFEALAYYKMPLLCHTGEEKAVINLNNQMNHPENLKTALQYGVTVIAAHCASKSTFLEKCYYASWEEMALKYENFYGDISAFGLPARVRLLQKIKKHPEIQDKMIYGSDIPVPILSAAFFPHMGVTKAMRLQFEKNPFNKSYLTMKHTNLSEGIFHRGEKLLRLHA